MRKTLSIATIVSTCVAFSAHALGPADHSTDGQPATSLSSAFVTQPVLQSVIATGDFVLAGNATNNGVKKQVKKKAVKPKPDHKNKRKGLFKKNEMWEKTVGDGQSKDGEGANTGLKTRDGKPVKLQSE